MAEKKNDGPERKRKVTTEEKNSVSVGDTSTKKAPLDEEARRAEAKRKRKVNAMRKCFWQGFALAVVLCSIIFGIISCARGKSAAKQLEKATEAETSGLDNIESDNTNSANDDIQNSGNSYNAGDNGNTTQQTVIEVKFDSEEGETQPDNYTGTRRFSDTIELTDRVVKFKNTEDVKSFFSNIGLNNPSSYIRGKEYVIASKGIEFTFGAETASITLKGYVYQHNWDYVYDLRIKGAYLNMNSAEFITTMLEGSTGCQNEMVDNTAGKISFDYPDYTIVGTFKDRVLTQVSFISKKSVIEATALDYLLVRFMPEWKDFFAQNNISMSGDDNKITDKSALTMEYIKPNINKITLSGYVKNTTGAILNFSIAGIRIGMDVKEVFDKTSLPYYYDGDYLVFYTDTGDYEIRVLTDSNSKVSTVSVSQAKVGDALELSILASGSVWDFKEYLGRYNIDATVYEDGKSASIENNYSVFYNTYFSAGEYSFASIAVTDEIIDNNGKIFNVALEGVKLGMTLDEARRTLPKKNYIPDAENNWYMFVDPDYKGQLSVSLDSYGKIIYMEYSYDN